MNVVIQAVGVVYGSCKASPLPERHADAAVSEGGGEAVGIVYFAYARVAVAGGKGFVKEHHARRAVKHEVASVNDIDGTRSRRQARVKVMILLVAIQLVHLKRHGKHRGESLRSGVVGQCGVERCAVHCYFDVVRLFCFSSELPTVQAEPGRAVHITSNRCPNLYPDVRCSATSGYGHRNGRPNFCTGAAATPIW